MEEQVLWKTENKIGHLILNDPPANKMNQAFFCRLKFLVNEIIPASNVRVIVVYGAGRHFSQGADLGELLSAIKDNVKTGEDNSIAQYPDFLTENNRSFSFFGKIGIPVIAAIRGVCIGSALELALFCSIKIAGDNSVFGFPESTFNLMPGCGGTQNILKYMNHSKAMEILLTGETFDAAAALGMNLVDAVVDRKHVIEKALEIAGQIVSRCE